MCSVRAVEPEGVQEADFLMTGSAGSLRPAQGALTEISIIIVIDYIIVIDILLIDVDSTAVTTYSAGALCAGDGVVEHVEADGACDEVLHAFVVYD